MRTAPVPAKGAQRHRRETAPKDNPKAPQGVSARRDNTTRRAGFSNNPTRPKSTAGGAVQPTRQPPPALAAIGRGFGADARPKGYDGQRDRHEPRPTQTQPGNEREASGFFSEGERGVKRPPSEKKPEAGSARQIACPNLHIIPIIRMADVPASASFV